MMRNPGRGSNATRLLVGGALAAALGGASTAWACSPQAVLNINDGVDSPLSGPIDSHPSVEISVTYPIGVAAEGTTIVLADDVAVLATRPMVAPSVKLTYTDHPTAVGVYVYHTYATDANGTILAGTRRDAAYIVTPAAAPVPTDSGTTTNDTGTNTVVDAPNTSTAPSTDTGTGATTGTETVAPAPVQAPVAARPAASTPAPARATTPAAQVATAPVVARPSSAPATAAPAPAPTASAAPVVGAPIPQQLLAPERGDLWSGLNPSTAPSLLDTSGPAASDSGLPIGAGLLGIGVLALAGVGAVAGQRRLALARRTKS